MSHTNSYPADCRVEYFEPQTLRGGMVIQGLPTGEEVYELESRPSSSLGPPTTYYVVWADDLKAPPLSTSSNLALLLVLCRPCILGHDWLPVCAFHILNNHDFVPVTGGVERVYNINSSGQGVHIGSKHGKIWKRAQRTAIYLLITRFSLTWIAQPPNPESHLNISQS